MGRCSWFNFSKAHVARGSNIAYVTARHIQWDTSSQQVLLYGPPGTGKTMLAKALQLNLTQLFSMSSLTSNEVGERRSCALFDLANKKALQLSIDEIDSMLTKRKSSEHNGRQLKTEFLVQFDGARTSERKGHVLIIGATNRPWDPDEAVLRRLAKRVSVADEIARRNIIEN